MAQKIIEVADLKKYYNGGFQRDREELQIIRVLLITGKMNFTDAMNMVYVTFYSLTRQPLVHQEESVF